MKRRVDEVQFGARGGPQSHHRILATQNNPASTIYQLTPGVLKAGTTDGATPSGASIAAQAPNVQYSTSKYIPFFSFLTLEKKYLQLLKITL